MNADDFEAQNTEACPYPSLRDVPSSAPSPIALTGKSLMHISSLSYSPSVFIRQIAEPVSRARFRASPRKSSRRRQALNEPDGTCTRVALRLWSGPRWGIFTPSTITARLAAGLSRSPDFQLHYGIELQDCSDELLRRYYPVEPPSNRTSHSRGIRLYGSWTMTASEARPLSSPGEGGFTGRSTSFLKRQIRGCVPDSRGNKHPAEGATIAQRMAQIEPYQ